VDRDHAAQAGDRHGPSSGGMAILGALTWLAMSQLHILPCRRRIACASRRRSALSVLALQIALGGWVSSNYARSLARTCRCAWDAWRRRWTSATHSTSLRELGQTPAGRAPLARGAHGDPLVHRMFALDRRRGHRLGSVPRHAVSRDMTRGCGS
jgi:cytochrome c oxidase assembly protein subunit 15